MKQLLPRLSVFAIIICLISPQYLAADGKQRKDLQNRVVTPELEKAARTAVPQAIDGTIVNRPPVLNGFSAVVGQTVYDYPANTVTARMLSRAPSGNLHLVFMKRFPDASSDRYVTYNYADLTSGVLFGEQSVTEDQPTGFGRVVNGPDGEALVAFHGGGAWVYRDVSEAGYSFSNTAANGLPILAANFPGIANNNATNEIWVSASSDAGGSFTPDVFFYSSDQGATWTQATFPSAQYVSGGIPGNSESWPIRNPATGEISMALTETDAAAGTTTHGALSWHSSTDNGGSWTSAVLLTEDDWFSGVDQSFRYFVENFDQFNTMYTDDGTAHVVFNGFGEMVPAGTTDSIAIFPVVYWNNSDAELIELTDPAVARGDLDYSNAVLAGYPGNGIGNSYPTISTAGNGELIVLWQQIEVGSDGLPVLAPDINGQPSTFYATDIWGAVSPDNGQSWSESFYVTGTAEFADMYPHLPRVSVSDADSIYLDYLYYEDSDPGTSLFSEGTASVGEWIFVHQGIARDQILGIEDGAVSIAGNFKLHQNYPNPFNPATTVVFELQKTADVRLEVFNVLGESVAVLSDGRMAAGQHRVNFEAGSLTSGVYFYSLTSEGVSQTRKMVLMR